MMRLNNNNILFWLILACFICEKMESNDKVNFKHSGQYIVTKRLLEGYFKQNPPRLDKPTEVKLGIYVNSFYSISETTMDYSVILYLKQSWVDPRLKFRSPDGKLHQMKMEEEYWRNIWVPDVFFRNEKKSSYHDITIPNRLLRINSSGSIWYTIKISATLSCRMNFEKYPLDTQICPLMFESFGYNAEVMYFTWMDKPLDVDTGLQLPQFTLIHKRFHDCSANYTKGLFSCLAIDFVLHRDIGYFIIQVYVPSILVVILSWVSFWINIDAHPARVSLGLLTVLTSTTMSGAARESLPRVSYIKAIDIWMITCLVFVFASLVEYAIVNVLSRRTTKKRKPTLVMKPERSTLTNTIGHRLVEFLRHRNRRYTTGPKPLSGQPGVKPTGPADTVSLMPATPGTGAELNKARATKVDELSRKCFPISFVLFNIIYWIAYTIPDSTNHA